MKRVQELKKEEKETLTDIEAIQENNYDLLITYKYNDNEKIITYIDFAKLLNKYNIGNIPIWEWLHDQDVNTFQFIFKRLNDEREELRKEVN